MPTTEIDRTAKNGKGGAAEGLAEGIAEGFEDLATMALQQAEESFKQGEKVGMVLRDQSIASIKSAEALGLSLMSAFADVTAPLTPKFPRVVPLGNVDAFLKAGFDVTQQLLSTERKLAETAVGLVTRQVG
jgi:hypothetical protein